jgi:hypothetical protein
MIWSSNRINTQDLSHLELKTYMFNWLKKFWQFSNFYGDYVSTPPSERGKFLKKHYPHKF